MFLNGPALEFQGSSVLRGYSPGEISVAKEVCKAAVAMVTRTILSQCYINAVVLT